MDKEELTEKQLDELKEQGYKTFEQRRRILELKQALKDYDTKLCNPY